MSSRFISRGVRSALQRRVFYQKSCEASIVLHKSGSVYCRVFSSDADRPNADRPNSDSSNADSSNADHSNVNHTKLDRSNTDRSSADRSDTPDDKHDEKKKNAKKSQQNGIKEIKKQKKKLDQVNKLTSSTASAGKPESETKTESKPSENGKSNSSTIPLDKKFLPLRITGKPPMPGSSHSYLLVNGNEIEAIYKSKRVGTKLPLVAFFARKHEYFKSVRILTDVDEVYDIGCHCDAFVQEIRAGSFEQTLRVVLHFGDRVEKGQLTKEEHNEKEEEEKREALESTKLDTASFEQDLITPLSEHSLANFSLMDHVVAKPDEPYSANDPIIQEICKEIVKRLDKMTNSTIQSEAAFKKASELTSDDDYSFANPAAIADFAAMLSDNGAKVQNILETLNVKERLDKTYGLLIEESTHYEIFGRQVREREESERKQALQQTQKIIAQQLGGNDDKEKLLNKWEERMAQLKIPEEVLSVIESEISRFKSHESGADYGVTRSYLDMLTQIPWGIYSTDSFDHAKAKKILDEEHFGLENIKKEILEFIAVAQQKNSIEGRMLCFCGPPGTGKSSIARSIAKALGRNFQRVSLGGVHDVSEIKGHRRTYVGALPGSIAQALKRSKTQNPVILLDEIDKTGQAANRGDVSSALLEVLDPELNSQFMDQYLDVPIDLSKVLFICTANDISHLPPPLMDRMELINLSSYDRYEKALIAERHLLKDIQKDRGLENADITFESETIDYIIKHYTVDAGVRKLKLKLTKIFNQLALGRSEGSIKEDDKIVITKEKARAYLGGPIHVDDKIYEENSPGVVLGLAANWSGGVALLVESCLQQPLSSESKPSVARTGRLRETLSESSSVAYTYSKAFMTKRFPGNRFFEFADIHIHLPEGAVEKDGPSGGITIATSLLSLALNLPVKPNLAMTGEMTLGGKVLPVGAIRDKVIAARNAGCDTIILPQNNMAAWEELPDYLQKGLRPVPVQWYGEVFQEAFGDVDVKKANDLWNKALRTKPSHEDEVSITSRKPLDSDKRQRSSVQAQL